MSQLTIYPADGEGRRLIASFPYSDVELREFIKTVPGREWNAKARVWILPGSPETLVFIRDHKPATCAVKLEEGTKERFFAEMASLRSARLTREAGDSAIEHTWVTQPYPHQRAGLAFLAAAGSAALLWEMGLGKTKTAIDYAEWLARRAGGGAGFSGGADIRVLVIAPNTVARNWGAEIEKHAGHRDFAMLTGTSIAKRVAQLGSRRYSIVNCEALPHRPFSDAAAAITWDLVIVDESTRFKTHNAERTKALHRIGKRAMQRVILTGTPITGNAGDAWSQFEFLRPGTFGEWYRFKDQFLETDFFGSEKGVKPGMTQELVDRIGRRSYRVLKADAIDLPPKVYTTRTVTLSNAQLRAYNQMRDELRIEIEHMPKVTATNVLTVLLRLTQITAGLIGAGDAYTWIPDNAKVQELDSLIHDELRGEQVVIFGLYQKELEALARRYTDPREEEYARAHTWMRGHELPIIYGPTPERVRHELVEQFQAGSRRLLFCQIRTGGIGINLTAAQTAIYNTRSWSLEEWLQSQDRLHRIGQKGTVSIVPLVAEGTVDEQIADALTGKQGLADTLTGDGVRRLITSVLGGK